MGNYDPLIYGKNQLERIVSIEPKGDIIEIFLEKEDGTVFTHFKQNKYWLLSTDKIDPKFVKLKGDLHYQYGKQFNNFNDWVSQRNYYRNVHDTYSISNVKEAAMVKDGITYYKGMQHKDVSILSFDIETTGLTHDDKSRVLLIANTFRRKGVIQRRLFAYDDYTNEGDMLLAWCEWVREINPSIICGHNIFVFDLPYLKYIADKMGVRLELGRDGSKIRFDKYESRFRKDAAMFYHYNKAHIYGRELVDTMFTAVRYDIGRKYESYSLKYITKVEGFDKPGDDIYDASKIRDNYLIPAEWQKIRSYAEKDGDRALFVYDLTTPPFFYLCQSIPKPYQLMLESASGSQINSVMVRSYLQNGYSLPKADAQASFEGAISFGNPGIYKNVFKVDVASLYPSIMLEYKIFDPQKDPHGNFLKLVSIFTDRRLKNKKLAQDTKERYYDDLQNAEKIFINSCYGFLGTPGLLFNYPTGASEVTKNGREILQKAIQWAESKGFGIVNADTDSIAITMQGEDLPAETRRSLLDDLNSNYPEKIRFTDDGYYSTVAVVKAKNYVLYDGTKIKIKGSALKASTKEPALKEFIKEIIMQIVQGRDNYVETYNRYVREALNVSDMKRWATRKTVTENVLNPERTNEQKILDALNGSEYVEGDRAYFFYKTDGSLCLLENFNQDYDKDVLLKKLFDTVKVFDSILPVKQTFPNYKLKKNKKLLDELLSL